MFSFIGWPCLPDLSDSSGSCGCGPMEAQSFLFPNVVRRKHQSKVMVTPMNSMTLCWDANITIIPNINQVR